MHFYAQFTVRNVFKPEKVQAVTTGAETLHVLKKKKKAEVVFFRAEKMNLFYPLLSWLYTKQQNCAQICYVFGFHYSSLQTHPQLTANIVPHDAAQKCDCPQEPKPVIYYLAVFCLTWVHSASLTVALSQAASPYL